MKINQWVIGVVMTSFLVGCGLTDKVSGVLSKSASNSYSTGVAGTYYAKLPYRNESLVVDLLLEKNQAYSMVKYPQNSADEYYEIGVWQQQGNKLTLTPKRSQKQKTKAIGVLVKDFLIKENNQLQLLDAKGKPYKKALHYTFKKK
ncbi:MAG: copper resistance protein NlpE N-terminal domain-containing protein [Gammaproteobacteria bacterium]|nr:copper resistance protein NlpE N-terminal domain-containing protein [Gammaproteobacteria bacterium]